MPKLPTLLLLATLTLTAQVPITPVMQIPNLGSQITPLAPHGATFTYLNPGLATYPNYVVGQAVTAITSPDKKTLVVVTTGDYGIYTATGSQDSADANDWLFIYDITNPAPIQKQVLRIKNSYNGLVFDPSGTTFYAAGGRDDNMHAYTVNAGVWAEALGSPIALGHTSQAGGTSPEAAGIAITKDGQTIILTNYENDSLTLLTKANNTWSKVADYDLRPGIINPTNSGQPGGEYPFWVSIVDATNTAYVSSIRDREIDVVTFTNNTLNLTGRIKLKGQPLKSTLNSSQSLLYVAEDQSDSIAVINTTTNALTAEVPVGAPRGVLPLTAYTGGNNTNSVTLSPNEKILYVTNGNTNNVAIVSVPKLLSHRNPVEGLIPTGMYPNSVAVSATGAYLYIVNGKSPTGANPKHCKGGAAAQPTLTTANCNASNSYSSQDIKAGLQFLPTPRFSQRAALTRQVSRNNKYASVESAATKATMDFMASKIQHVVYIIKENRTYDQMLGDLPIGNADPALCEFPAPVTPNLHKLAQSFVTLDNFYDTAEISYDGWAWSTGLLAPDIIIRQVPVDYSFRGGTAYESEGDNRGINLVARTGTNASNPDVLPGLTDTDAPDGPDNQVNTGYLWNQALRAGLTVRNYGFFVDNIGTASAYPQNESTPQVRPSSAILAPLTDLSYRGFDMNNADFFLYEEWAHDFDTNYANAGFPNLNLIRLPHDHTGNYSTALAGLNTPELQEADNDYAVGLIIQKIAASPYANNTLIFIVEDDAQNGGDHVDAHRSIAFIVGPYVKQGGALVSTPYNTINFGRTIERVLGLKPMHLTDTIAQPMADVFNITQPPTWSYVATPSAYLYKSGYATQLPTPAAGMKIPESTHNAEYWTNATKGMDFSEADKVNPDAFNRILWQGLKGNPNRP